MKKMFMVLVMLLSVGNSLQAKSSDITLELARANKMDKVIQRINQVYEYANSYIQEAADPTLLSKSTLMSKYSLPEKSFEGYSGAFTVEYKPADKTIVFSDAAPSNLTNRIKGIIKNSTTLLSCAFFDSASKKFVYRINEESKKHINQLSNTEYVGGIKVASSLADFDGSAPVGTISYIKDNDSAKEYVKSKDGWVEVATTSKNILATAGECTVDTLGSIRVSKANNCTQFCAKGNGTPTWKCF